MKASIITLVLSDNYGAALQSAAFAHALKKCGAEPTFYRYQDWSRITYGMSKAAHIKHFAFNCIKTCLTQGIRQKRFDAFRKSYIPMTEKLYGNNKELRQDPGDYDVYISGSDQIWNPKLFLFDYSYFLDFAPEGAKRISFASSFGKADFEEDYKEKCGNLLSKYSHISVREKSGEKIVKDLCGRTPALCVDPTLLLTKEDWVPMMAGASKKSKTFKGILCYHMPGDGLVQTAIESIAQQLHQKTGLPIMRLGVKEHTIFRYPQGETDIKAGPAEFLQYFSGAQYVVTNSFHGTAFAMNFDKTCYNPINDTLPPEKALHERIVSLLEQTEATCQMLPASNPVLPESDGVDRAKSQILLQALREQSLAYLKAALADEKDLGDKKMKITDTEKCFGCGACQQICPKNAISMVPDSEGFLRPEVNEELCVNCGLCQKACPAEDVQLKTDYRKAYALKHNEDAIRNKSTSGGAFIAMSDEVFKEGGVVYGVIYDENWKAVHTRATSRRERDPMCGSKYVQSDCGDTFSQVAEDLKNGKKVLFTGTSCQIDGLQHYLSLKNIPTDKLITVGLICHGTPSPLMWQEHLNNVRTRRRKEITGYANRSKVKGWHGHNEHITFSDGSQDYYSKLAQNHKDLFSGHLIIRPSCPICPYTPNPCAADITIADFWGCEDLVPGIDDNKGISMVLVNSEKGNALIEKCTGVTLWETDYQKSLSHNYIRHWKVNPLRAQFWEDYHKYGYAYVCSKYANDNFLGRIRYGAKKRLRVLLVKLKIKPA